MRIGKKGFTLVEIIVSLAIMSIVAGAVGAFVIAGNNSYMRGNRELTLQEEAQLTANQLIDLIIDVERGINFQTTIGSAVDEEGHIVADNVPAAELILRNNDNVYMVRWQGGSGYDSANQLYLYEASNGGKDSDGNMIWGDPVSAAPSLMAEYVTAFNIDLTDLDKRKVKLEMKFSYQDKTYDISETIKLRNDLSGEESTDYAWITGLTIEPTTATVARGATQTFTYKLTGDKAAVEKGVTWKVTKADGTPCNSSIDSNGKLSVALDEELGDGVLLVTCTAVADSSKVATAVVDVKLNYSISISPKVANVMQGKTAVFTCTVTKTENGVTETVTGMAVEWDVTADGVEKDAGTKVENGVLTVGRKQATGVLQVTCTLSEDTSKSDKASVTVLPYSVVDQKYDAKLIAERLTTYDLGDGRVGYTGQIECLPSWADYQDQEQHYPKIKWSIPEDPTQSRYTITGNQGPNESQYTATLKCGNQSNDNVRVVANVQLSADVTVVLDIVIVIPNLTTATIADAPYIDSQQFVLNRNDKITCSIQNYHEDGGKVLWKIADLPSDLYYNCKHPSNISYQNPMVGLVPLNHLGEGDTKPTDYPVNDTIDQDHGTFDLLQTHKGTTTDVWAKYYINMNEEYHVTLQAWSLDGTKLVAETTILIPKFDILFYNGEHVKDIEVPTWNTICNIKFYGYTNTNEINDKYGTEVTYGIGYHPLYLDGEIKGEVSNSDAYFYAHGLDKSQPDVSVAIYGQSMDNDYMILSFWNKGHPDVKRNLFLKLKK